MKDNPKKDHSKKNTSKPSKESTNTLIDELLPALQLAIETEGRSAIKYSKKLLKKLWRAFWCFVAFTFFIPLALIILDLVFKKGWLTGIAGIILSLTLTCLLFQPLYLGISGIIGAVLAKKLRIKEMVESFAGGAIAYLNIVLSVLLWELIVVVYLTIIPIWINPRALQVMIMGSILVSLMSYCWGYNFGRVRYIAFLLVISAMARATFSCLFPETAEAIREKKGLIDIIMAGCVRSQSLAKLTGNQKNGISPENKKAFTQTPRQLEKPLPTLSPKDQKDKNETSKQIDDLVEKDFKKPF